jgi:hypothetical protein
MRKIILTSRTIRLFSLAVMTSLICSCSTAGKDVVPVYVSPAHYSNFDCDQVREDLIRINTKVAQITGRLDQAASNDKALMSAGLLIFWPALFVLGGTKQQEAELSRLKGEYDALQAVGASKKCGSFQAIVSVQKDSETNLKFGTLNPIKAKKQPERDAVAVIVGISDYKNLPPADFANNDARVFYGYAVRALGIKPENIRLLVDGEADQGEIYRAFKIWLPSRVRASTDVYVYYSGHGLPTTDGHGFYWLPQRADRDFIDKTAITQQEINSYLQSAKPKSVTIFLDSCYSGQIRTGEALISSARPVVLKVDRQIFPENFTVITSGKFDQISSSSPDLQHGIFSYYLMQGIEGKADLNGDGQITAGEMQAFLTEQVVRQAGMMNRRQEPQLIGDQNKVLVGK